MRRVPPIVIALSLVPLAFVAWLAVLLVQKRFAEAVFYSYGVCGLIAALITYLGIRVIGPQSAMFTLGSAINNQGKGLGRVRSRLTTFFQVLSALFGWPGAALLLYKLIKRMPGRGGLLDQMKEQLVSSTYMFEEAVLWMPIGVFALCVLLFAMTGGHAKRGSYEAPCYVLILASVLVRQLWATAQAGQLLPLLRRLPGNHLWRFVVILAADFGSTVLALTAVRGVGVTLSAAVQAIPSTARLLVNPKGLQQLLAPTFSSGLVSYAWHTSFSDKLTFLSGLMLYMVALQSVVGIFQQYKRTDEEKIVASSFLIFRGQFQKAHDMISEITTITPGREEIRSIVELALGRPARAVTARRHLLEETFSGKDEDVDDSDVYGSLVMSSHCPHIPSEAAISLWSWGRKHGVKSAVLLFHASDLFTRAKDITELAPMFPPGIENDLPLPAAFYFLFSKEIDKALHLVPNVSFNKSVEGLASMVVWFGAAMGSRAPEDRLAFADDFPEAWKEYVKATDVEIALGPQWQVMLGMYLISTLAGWMRRLGSSQEAWLEQEHQKLVRCITASVFGAQNPNLADDMMRITRRAAEKQSVQAS